MTNKVDTRAWTNWNLNWIQTLKNNKLIRSSCYRFVFQFKKLQERFAKEEELRKELEEKLTGLMEEKNELFQNLQSVRT